MADIKSNQRASNEFLVRITVRDEDPCDADEVRRVIEYLGGNESDEGFTFSSATARSVALELLGDKFGSRYVTAVERDKQGEGNEGLAKTTLSSPA